MLNETKETILKELKEWNEKLNKSPGRRDIPLKLNKDCCKYFGSLNKAKSEAGLKIFKRKADELKFESTILTKELVRIIAYITGDGHLHKDLKGFLHSSKDINSLKDFEYCVRKQFGLEVSKIQESNETSYGDGLQYRYFNTTVAKFLYSIGTPKGDKVDCAFSIPLWIRINKYFMKDYLQVLFYCEGCRYYNDWNKIRIQINMRKTEDYISQGKRFMHSLKEGLKDYFDIDTGRTGIYRGTKRNKDNKETKDFRFVIRAQSINKFISKIGWLK